MSLVKHIPSGTEALTELVFKNIIYFKYIFKTNICMLFTWNSSMIIILT